MIPVIILAGGQARRMGGGDKCLLPVGNRVILDLILGRLAGQTDRVLLNANGDPARFAAWDMQILPDSVDGHPGPLAGVLAGLDWAHENGVDHICTVAGDTPFFPRDLVARLAQNPPLCLAASRRAGKTHRQPAFGLWPAALRTDLRGALQGGVRKIIEWTGPHGAGQVVWDAPETDPFFNINTPDDLRVAERLA